ncbi:MAG: Mobile element protein, partial [Olavius algarvensis Gamma 1 endosymbiont]
AGGNPSVHPPRGLPLRSGPLSTPPRGCQPQGL